MTKSLCEPSGVPSKREEREDSDAALVDAALRGDRAAFNLLVAQCASEVGRVLHRQLGVDHEAEDLKQDVIHELVKCVPQIRQPRSLRNYVISITVNRIRNEIRHRKIVRRVMTLTPNGNLPDVASEETSLIDGMWAFGVANTLRHLQAEDRAAFLMRRMEGRSLREIAHASQVSLATVKRRITRAEQAFRLKVGGEDAVESTGSSQRHLHRLPPVVVPVRAARGRL